MSTKNDRLKNISAKKTHKQIYALVDKFLEHRVKANEDGYVACSDDDITQLCSILNAILKTKYEGKPPVEYTLVNRTKYESLLFVPYRHVNYMDRYTQQEFDEMVRSLKLNAKLANDKLETFLSVFLSIISNMPKDDK